MTASRATSTSDPLTDRACRWLGIHAALVAGLALLAVFVTRTMEYPDTISLPVLIAVVGTVPLEVGAAVLGWPWPELTDDGVGLLLGGPVVNLGIHVVVWLVVLLRQEWQTRQRP